MSTYDQMLLDNQYTNGYDTNTFSYSQQPPTQQDGQTDYSQAPEYGQKQEQNTYRHVSSRLTDQASVQTGSAKSPYGVASNKSGANSNHSQIPHGQGSKPVSSQGQSSTTSATIPGMDTRQDSLLGPLFAELDSLAHQPEKQNPSSHAPSVHSRSSVSYQSNHDQQNGSSQPNRVLSNIANRTPTNGPRGADLYHSLDPKDPLNMDGTDIFMPSSNVTGQESYYNQYDPDNPLYQKSSKQQHQHDTTSSPGPSTFKQQNTNPFIDYKSASSRDNASNNDELLSTDRNTKPPANNQQNKDSTRPGMRNKTQDTRGTGQVKNAKKLQLPGQGRGTIGSSTTSNSYGAPQSFTTSESPRRLSYHPPIAPKPNYIEKNMNMIKNKENYYHRYPARKYENLYSKRKQLHGGNDDHENHQQEQESQIHTTSDNSQNESMPATLNIPLDGHINQAGENVSVDINLRVVDSQNPSQQQQQQQPRQGSDHPNWTSSDALDRHIRKMERSINQNLPATHPHQRSPVLLTTSASPLTGRAEKSPTGVGHSGSYALNHRDASYNYSDKGREEDSYLAKMNSKRHVNFKPYTGRDYERFKKNCGFGTGHLGFDPENTMYKEKVEQVSKAREYAQQVETRNKKMISEASNRISPGRRLSVEESKTLQLFEHPQLSKRTMRFTSKSTHSSPVSMTEIVPLHPDRRPTDVLYRSPPGPRPSEVIHQLPPARRPSGAIPHSPPTRRQVEVVSRSPPARRPVEVSSRSPPTRRLVEVVTQSSSARRPVDVFSQGSPTPRQRIRFHQNEDDETTEIFHRYEERDVTPVKRSLNPPKKRREQNDEDDRQPLSNVESSSPHRISPRRLSPVKLSSPTGRFNSDNNSKRRPLRFDNFPPSDEPVHPSPQHNPQTVHQYEIKSSEDQSDNPQIDDDALMKVIRDELRERPLQEGEELVIVQ